MAGSPLDKSDHDLITRCHRDIDVLPDTIGLVRFMFWLGVFCSVGITVCALLAALDVPDMEEFREWTPKRLLNLWLGTLLLGAIAEALRTRVKLARLVCKLTDGDRGTPVEPPAADRST
jgi:hypothetical protein